MKNINSNIHIAKVDEAKEKVLHERFNITYFPTHMMFYNQNNAIFKGNFDAESIIRSFSNFGGLKMPEPEPEPQPQPQPQPHPNNENYQQNDVLLLNNNNFEATRKEFSILVVKFC